MCLKITHLTFIESAGTGAGTVYIMDADTLDGEGNVVKAVEYGKGLSSPSRNLENHLTVYDVTTAHTAKVTIRGYKGTDSHLGSGKYWGGTGDIVLAGPTVFEDISILMTRLHDSGVAANGYSMTVGENVHFYRPSTDFGTDRYGVALIWDGVINEKGFILKSGYNYPATHPVKGNGGEIVINSTASAEEIRFEVPAWADNRTYAEDTTIRVNRAPSGIYFRFGGKADGGYISSATYSKNLNFVFSDSVKSVRYIASDSNASSGTVNGGMQIIIPASVSYTYSAGTKMIVKGGTWLMKTAAAGMLDVTETAGTFSVASGTVYAYGNGKTIYYNKTGNTLTVPAGEWQVTSDKATATAYKPAGSTAFLGWTDNGDGTMTAQFEQSADLVYVSNRYGNDANNGLTEATPLKTLAAAVNKIGLDRDGTVIVMDGKNGDEYEYAVYTRDNSNTYGGTQDVLQYTGTGIPAHTGTITYQGKTQDSVICFGMNHMEIRGPSAFKNISLIEGYNTGKQMITFGYDVAFENVAYVQTGVSSTDNASSRKANACLKFDANNKLSIDVSGRSDVANKGTLVLTSSAPKIGEVGIGGWDGNRTISADQKVIVNGASVDSLKLLNNKDTWNMQNINVVLNSAVGKLYNRAKDEDGNNKGSATVNAIQVVENNGVDVAYDDTDVGYGTLTVKEGVWFLKGASGVFLDTTDTSGVFTSDAEVYAYQPGGTTIYYGTNLTLPAGDWFVAASEADAKTGNGTPIAPSSQKVFDSWVDNGNGTITATFRTDAAIVPGVYYVMYLGTGAGRTPDDPMGRIADAINAIQADSAVTSGTVYVMNNPEYKGNELVKDAQTIHYTAWSTPSAHTKEVTICGYDPDSTTFLTSNQKCGTGDIVVSGPTKFTNITLFSPRNCDEGIQTGGHDVTFDNTVLIKSFKLDTWNKGAWTITSPEVQLMSDDLLHFGTGRSTSNLGQGGRVTVNTTYDLKVSNDWQGGNYTNDVTLAVDTAGHAFSVDWGKNTTKPGIYHRNLNLVVGNVSSMSHVVALEKGTVTVGGDLQVIHPAGTTFTAPSNFTVNGSTYDLTTETAGMLDVTNVSGKYLVSGEDTVAATDTANSSLVYLSMDGVLTVPAGSYTVAKVADSSTVATLTFDETYASIAGMKGTKVQLPTCDNQLLKEFKGWKLSGDNTVYAGGSLYTIAADAADTLVFTSVWGDYEDTVLVFLDTANGNDSNDGLTAETAFKTIAKAFEVLNGKAEGTKKVAVVGTLQYSGNLPSNSTMITITGDGTGNSVFDLYNDYVLQSGPITFENIALDSTTRAQGKHFTTDGHELVLGKGITTGRTKMMPIRFGRMNQNATTKQIVTFESGSFGSIELGTFYNQNSVRHSTPGADITVNGGTVNQLYLYSDSYMDTMVGNDFTDDVRVIVNGGTLKTIEAHTSDRLAAAFTNGATFQYIGNNGASTTVSGVGSVCDSVWVIKGEKADGCYLDFTDTPGVYKVYGEKTAIAYQNESEVAVSMNGTITIPKGTTTVKYVDKIDYLYLNDAITFYSDVTDFDVTAVTPATKTGKVFIGWKKGDKNAEKVADYVAGDVLTAQYVNFDSADNGDFYIVGVQIRKGSETVQQGLRFIIEKKDSFASSLPEVVDYGSLVLPTDLTRGHDIKYNTPLYNEYLPAMPEGAKLSEPWTSGSWKSTDGPSAVPGTKTYRTLDDGIQYTVCIVNIAESNYDRFYTVKGYIRYNDLNGVERVVYTDYYQTNLYKVAQAAVNAGETAESISAVKNYYETTRKDTYMAEQYDNRTDLKTVKKDSALKSWADTEGAATLPNIKNADFYSLKNGIKVREVEYDYSNGSDRKPVEIVQLGDTHLNYVNDRDWDEQSTCILATYKGREWNRNGASAPIINQVMQYASFFDQTVITGDVLDYFSWGCGEMVQKLIVDKDPSVLMAIGNHEPAIHMQNVEHVCNTDSSLDAVHARLSEFWPNDTKYDSRIITNEDGIEMAKLVVLDDQAHQFAWECIYNGLSADIAEARKKNIPILIFAHCPISTRGGAEEDRYTFFYEPGDIGGFDKSTLTIDLGKREAGSKGTELDTRIYKLITNNADVIRGIFVGDYHNFMYTEVKGVSGKTGEEMMIPQYVASANAYGGRVTKITIK